MARTQEPPEKPLHWVASAKKDLLGFPEGVVDDFGYALGVVQQGGTPPLGELVAAGYNELREQSICCQDTLQTFLLLGDPLTTVKISAGDQIFLPIIRNLGG